MRSRVFTASRHHFRDDLTSVERVAIRRQKTMDRRREQEQRQSARFFVLAGATKTSGARK